MANVLITGGAGYIGSHAARDLAEHGHYPIVLDNLSEGHWEAVGDYQFAQGDIGEGGVLDREFATSHIDAVMHFAASAYVGESVENPEKYYRNNVAGTLNLLAVMRRRGVKTFIFSSSCAAYGVPRAVPIDETHPQAPVNPYGATKLMVERILSDYAAAYGIRYAALRYFNAAGAHPDGTLGESHRTETHLIPLVLQAIAGRRWCVRVFGDDYDTPDGTCIRDYIHVCDLASAHRAALERLLEGAPSFAVNLGTGRGYSVKEIIAECEKVTGRAAPVETAPRRPGDPPALVAANGLAKTLLGWEAAYTLTDSVRTAWAWEQNRRY